MCMVFKGRGPCNLMKKCWLKNTWNKPLIWWFWVYAHLQNVTGVQTPLLKCLHPIPLIIFSVLISKTDLLEHCTSKVSFSSDLLAIMSWQFYCMCIISLLPRACCLIRILIRYVVSLGLSLQLRRFNLFNRKLKLKIFRLQEKYKNFYQMNYRNIYYKCISLRLRVLAKIMTNVCSFFPETLLFRLEAKRKYPFSPWSKKKYHIHALSLSR
jgi:hypothetical protein